MIYEFSKNAFNKLKWKWIKDMFTLGKNLAEVCKSIIVWYQSL